MLKIKNLSKSYQDKQGFEPLKVISGISIDVNDGEIVSIYGPNGSGKSTLLKLIAGILKSDKGSVEFSGRNHDVGYVWQNYSESLLPWCTVEENIELANTLSVPGVKNESSECASLILKKIGFNLRIDAYPYQLSGGQQQMTAIARSLCGKPSVLLFDEPFSALDQKKRNKALVELRKFCIENRVITFFVSHDLDESILFSNRLILLSDLPSSVVGDIAIELKSERDMTLLTSNDFIEYRNQALDIINKDIT